MSARMAALLATSIALCACSEAEPSAPAQPTSTSTSTTAPSASEAPSLPVEAEVLNESGAEAFVKHWFALASYGYRTGDVAPLRDASRPDCGTCSNMVAQIEATYQAGNHYEGGEITVLAAVSPPIPEGQPAAVSARITQTELRVVAPDGAVIETAPAEPGITLGAVVERTDGAWSIRALARNDS